MKIKVNPISQRNYLWSWMRLGNTRSSIYWYGCYFISLFMFFSSKGFIYSLVNLLNSLKKSGGFSGDQINPSGVLSLLGRDWKYERKDWETKPAEMGVIQELIDSGYPVITKVDFNPSTRNIDGHFVLVTGYVLTNGKITDLYANDPWTGKEILLNQYYPYLKSHKIENAVMGLRIYRRK